MVTKTTNGEAGEHEGAHAIGRRRFLQYTTTAMGVASLAGLTPTSGAGTIIGARRIAQASGILKRVAADPTHIPPPIARRRPEIVPIVLEAREIIAEIEPGVLFRFMTYNG